MTHGAADAPRKSLGYGSIVLIHVEQVLSTAARELSSYSSHERTDCPHVLLNVQTGGLLRKAGLRRKVTESERDEEGLYDVCSSSLETWGMDYRGKKIAFLDCPRRDKRASAGIFSKTPDPSRARPEA